jgi:hypothetical protein
VISIRDWDNTRIDLDAQSLVDILVVRWDAKTFFEYYKVSRFNLRNLNLSQIERINRLYCYQLRFKSTFQEGENPYENLSISSTP